MAFPLTSKIPSQLKTSGNRYCLFPQGLTSNCLSFMLPQLVERLSRNCKCIGLVPIDLKFLFKKQADHCHLGAF